MSLPAELLQLFPQGLLRKAGSGELESGGERDRDIDFARVLPLQLPEFASLLPDGGLPRGAITELCVTGAAAGATRLALQACGAAQHQSLHKAAHLSAGGSAWCAWVDPSGTLHGPALTRMGVNLEQVLVVRPEPERLGSTGLRLLRARCFSVVVVDACGVPGMNSPLPRNWERLVRQFALAVENSPTCLLLITRSGRQRLPLPVALRLELSRPEAGVLCVAIGKERHGRLTGTRRLDWNDCWRHQEVPWGQNLELWGDELPQTGGVRSAAASPVLSGSAVGAGRYVG
jgi:hypothetical protein